MDSATSSAYRDGYYHAQDDLRLYYRDYGDPASPRTPLLCLSGLTRNAADFDGFARRWAAERRIICLDYRGRGRSAYDPDWRNYRAETYLNDIRHLLALLDLDKVVVVGTSLGGILGMVLGVLQPKGIAGVVLNDVGPELAPQGIERILDFIGTDRPQRDWPSAIAYLKSTFPMLSLQTEGEWKRMARGTFALREDGLLHFDWDVALVKPLRANGAKLPELWPYFRSLRRMPVLAIRGGVSDVLSEVTFDRMAAEKPDLLRVTVPAVGHAPSLDEPAARSALEDFLGSL